MIRMKMEAAMSIENVEIVKSIDEAFARRDIADVFGKLADDVELVQ